MPANNVIAFPLSKRNSPPQTMEEVIDVVQKARLDHIDIILEQTLMYIGCRFMEEGFDVAKPDCDKSMYLVEEAIKAALCTSVGIYHPMTEFAEEIFAEMTETEDKPPE